MCIIVCTVAIFNSTVGRDFLETFGSENRSLVSTKNLHGIQPGSSIVVAVLKQYDMMCVVVLCCYRTNNVGEKPTVILYTHT